MTSAQVIFLPLKVTFYVTNEQQMQSRKANEILKINISNHLDSIRHLPIALFRYKKNEVHKLIRSRWELIHGDKDL
jgi:hypothetical protein